MKRERNIGERKMRGKKRVGGREKGKKGGGLRGKGREKRK